MTSDMATGLLDGCEGAWRRAVESDGETLAVEPDTAGVGVDVEECPWGARIRDVFPGSPAADVRLIPGECIVAVDESELAGRLLSDMVALLRGSEGSLVRLRIRATDGAQRTLDLRRRSYHADSGLSSAVAQSSAIQPGERDEHRGLIADASSLRAASRGRRCAAAIVDLLLVPLAIGIVLGILIVVMGIPAPLQPLLLVAANAAWLVVRDTAGSPGRAMVGIELRHLDGSPVGLGTAIARNIHLMIPFILVVGNLVELIAVLATGRRIADRWARTMVVDRPQPCW